MTTVPIYLPEYIKEYIYKITARSNTNRNRQTEWSTMPSLGAGFSVKVATARKHSTLPSAGATLPLEGTTFSTQKKTAPATRN